MASHDASVPPPGSGAALITLLPNSRGRCERDGPLAPRTLIRAETSKRGPVTTTRTPVGGPLPSAAGFSTMPATSQPVIDPSGSCGKSLTSPRLRERAHPDQGLVGKLHRV